MGEVTENELAGIAVINPRTGDELYRVQEYSDSEVVEIYERAATAYETIRAMTVRERLEQASRLKACIRDERDKICDRIIEETGKCKTDALLTEIFPALDIIDYYEKNAERFLADQKVGKSIALLGPGTVQTIKDFLGKKLRVFYEPLGTVLVISPWNYPFHLGFLPVISAFLAGNSVVLKPSTQTPLKGLYEEMFEKSGFVKDGVQVVYGSRKTGEKLIDAKPAKIFSTGSVGGGRAVMRQAAEHLTPVELELGGKDPMIVFEDVNLERAVNGALWGGMVNCGQTCTSVERVYVHESIADRFVEMLKEKAAKLRTRDDLGDEVDEGQLSVGCMTPEFQVEIVERQLADATEKGAEIAVGGSRKAGSHVFPPTVVLKADDTMDVMREETFGPVITVTPFKTEDEVVEMANNSRYGLNSSVWSGDLSRAERVARRVETGNVSVNNVLATQATAALPFGGVKESGFGRYHGPWGLHTFCNIKSVSMEPCSSKIELNWYPYSKEKFALLSRLIGGLFSDSPFALPKVLPVANKLAGLLKKQRL